MIGAILSMLGCKQKDDPVFGALVQKAMNDLQAKTASHQGLWGFGKAQRWDLNQTDGRLIFTFPDKVVSCEAQIVGSYDKSRGTWLWAWDNPSVLSNLTAASRALREYGKQHGYAKLTCAEWKATEGEAWEMAALATLVGDAQGVYRGPAGDSYVFITFGTPKIEKRQGVEPDAASEPPHAAAALEQTENMNTKPETEAPADDGGR